jgi:hypothetical protein
VRVLDGAKSFQRDDLSLTHSRDRRRARPDSIAVQYDRASATLGEAAAKFGAVQPKIIAQRRRATCCPVRQLRFDPSVECEGLGHRNTLPSSKLKEVLLAAPQAAA